MAQSSSSHSVSNLSPDRVPCQRCGGQTTVLLSHTEQNPGRLFYSCADHGFSRWVIESGSAPRRRTVAIGRHRGAILSEGRNAVEFINPSDPSARPESNPTAIHPRFAPAQQCRCHALVLTLSIFNLIAIAAIMVILLTSTTKRLCP